jgi:hypothetical protein
MSRDALITDVFHAHLDVCQRCREHPFSLCAIGADLLGMPQDRTAGALVPLHPWPMFGGPTIIKLGPGRDREELLQAIEDLAWEARFDGHQCAFHLLARVVRAMRAARGVDLEYELLIFLEREGVL